MPHFKKTYPFLLTALCFVFSCQRDVEIEPWTPEILAPIASTKLNLQNIVSQNNYNVNDSGQVELVFSSSLYQASGLDFFAIPDAKNTNVVSLESITLSDDALSTKITLEEAYAPAKLLHGRWVPLPSLTLNNAGKADVDAQTFFSSALLESGFMIVEIKNGFPVELDTLEFELTNKSDNSQVANMIFFDIPPGQTVVDTAKMDGVYAEGQMNGTLLKVVSAATTDSVKINKFDALELNVAVKDLKAIEAEAVFPAQDLIDIDLNWRYDFGGPRIKEMRILSGKLNLEVISTINETIYVTYQAPGLAQNGEPVSRRIIVPPAKNGIPHKATEVVDLSGVEVNLRGKASEGYQEENAMNYKMKASIQYTGELKKISKTDSIYVYVGLEELVPEYALGYFGQFRDTIGPEKIKLNTFDNLDGQLDLKDAIFRLNVRNEIGMDALVGFENISSTNKRGSQIKLTADLFKTGLTVDAAVNKGKPAIIQYDFTPDNSNVDAFIENLPKTIEYALNLETNPGTDTTFDDFMYHDSKISADLDMILPLSIKTDGFTMTDTVSLNFSGYDDLNSIKRVELNLISYNYYPMEAKVKFVMLDQNLQPIDTLFNDPDQLALPGLFDGFGDKIVKPSKSVFTSTLTTEQFKNVLANARKAIIIVQFDTYNSDHKVIYDDYYFDVQLTGKFLNEISIGSE
ncbi:MAG: hypothetical protein KDC92_07610 [Bacteroidetes bacterium]|nr:hypothetical protein [Bacteroidota bacterium]